MHLLTNGQIVRAADYVRNTSGCFDVDLRLRIADLNMRSHLTEFFSEQDILDLEKVEVARRLNNNGVRP